MAEKPKTTGVSPKVPFQAIASIITFLLAYFAVDLSPELSGLIAAVIGAIGGYQAPPGNVEGPTNADPAMPLGMDPRNVE